MKFSVIVPVFNHPSYTKACLNSLLGNTSRETIEILVIDNGSLGATKRLLESYGSAIKLIRNESNLGHAAALNIGLKASSNDRVVMIHNDCVVFAGFETSVVSAFTEMEQQNIVKLASPLTNYSDEPAFTYSSALESHFVKHKFNNKSHPSYEDVLRLVEQTYSQYGGSAAFVKQFPSQPLFITDQISSFCVLGYRDTLLDLGGFCEEFKFRGSEEKDLLLRYNERGFICARAGFFVHHFGNITSDGPGFSLPNLMAVNDQIFKDRRSHFLRTNNDGIKPWTAVIFPDKNPDLAKRLRDNLAESNLPPSQIIEPPHPGIFPITKAWEWILPQVRCDFIGRLDADMLLFKEAPQKMLKVLDQDARNAMAAALLDDPCIGKMGHLVFWRTHALKQIPHEKTPAMDYELFYLRKIQGMGMKVGWIDDVLGRHAIDLDPWTIFRAFLRRGIKTRLRGLGADCAVSEISGALEKGSPWSHIAMIGFHTGIQLDYLGDPHDAAFDQMAKAQYAKVEPFCIAVARSAPVVAAKQSHTDDRIKVAFLMGNLNIGGIEIVMKILDEMIDRSKFKTFVYSRLGGVLASSLKSEVRIASDGKEVIDDYSLFMDWMIHDKIDVAVLMTYWCSDELFYFGKPCRIIERTDGAMDLYTKTPGIVDLLVYESDSMDKIIGPSPCDKKMMIPNGRNPIPRNPESRARIRSEFGVAEDDVFLVNVSRITHGKRQFDLVLMVDELRRRGHENVKVLCMGPDNDGARLKSDILITEKKLKDRFFFKEGSVEDVHAVLSAADIFVSATEHEGLAGMYVEACAAGLPIVATDVGATKDVVKETNGTLVPRHQPLLLAAAVEPFILSKAKREAAGKASLEISKKYSADSMTRLFEQAITEQAHAAKKQQPLITILMPVWQRHEFLDAAIKSVLRQTCKDWRMIIAVDDEKPTPQIKEIIDANTDSRIRVIYHPHKNQCRAMNYATRYVDSEYVMRLDSDDELAECAVEQVSAAIRKNPDIGFFYSERDYIDENGKVIEEKAWAGKIEDFSPARLEKEFIVRKLQIWKKIDFLKARGFDEDVVYGEDYLLPLMMMLHGTRFMPIRQSLVKHREHSAGNISNDLSAEQKDMSLKFLRTRYHQMKRSMGLVWGEDIAEPAGPQQISFIVTCKGRLDHAKRTIDSVIAQPDSEYVFVDYDCPQRSGEWVKSWYPEATIVSVKDQPLFNLSKARNLGARSAKGKWLCFLDCDVSLHPSFSKEMAKIMKEGVFIGSTRYAAGLSGTILCKKSDFIQAGGFDENFKGWGGEDDDFKRTLRQRLEQVELNERLIFHIDHSDDQRTKFYEEKDISISNRANNRYLHQKHQEPIRRFHGPWTKQDHLECYRFDYPLSEAMAEIFKGVSSVLDFGCGLGHYLKRFEAPGRRLLGIEPLPMGASSLTIMEADIFQGDPIPNERFELVICIEVAEHIERSKHEALFDFLDKHCSQTLVFSGAIPGQGGDGHISERPEAEWRAEIEKRGFVEDVEKTKKLRESAKLWWFKKNIMVFSK